MPAKSRSQQRLFGMVHAYNKGELKGSKSMKKYIGSIAKGISDEDARHFAATSHKGLPEKKSYALPAINLLASGKFISEKVAQAAAPIPKGAIRNNNPGNLRFYNQKWYGELPKGLTPEKDFTRFNTPYNGLRAAAGTLRTIGRRAPKFTISNVMPVYSPKNENNVQQHIKNVSSISGLDKNKVLDPNNDGHMVDFLRGTVGAESGQRVMNLFTPQDYTNAVRRARQNL